jgi:hypothetical protein
MNRFAVLALDLEGTPISNAMSQIPRSGLFAFLERCRALFPRVVMFTTVKEERFSQDCDPLVAEGTAPACHPGQESQWVQVDYFEHPYDEPDTGLTKVPVALQLRVGRSDAI